MPFVNTLKSLVAFVQESWHEVRHKVTWPGWVEVRGTALVVCFTTVMFGIYLGVLDLLLVTAITEVFKLFA